MLYAVPEHFCMHGHTLQYVRTCFVVPVCIAITMVMLLLLRRSSGCQPGTSQGNPIIAAIILTASTGS
jgi:hypothetical protein